MKVELDDFAVDGVMTSILKEDIKAVKNTIKEAKNIGYSKAEIEEYREAKRAMKVLIKYYEDV